MDTLMMVLGAVFVFAIGITVGAFGHYIYWTDFFEFLKSPDKFDETDVIR